MAAPVVAGVAAMLKSHFPSLSAKEIRQIIMQSTVSIDRKVIKPGTDELVDFSKLSVTGGVVNAYEAVQMAMSLESRSSKKAAESKKIPRT